ncbi:ATP synthase subunit a [Austwickia sp. TVS 96-490-7B]|uniref:F0F1 ATP synthase subunit A n=1 Tax=Austwickia sp. TVS 96-490-7B TaxID=2830843 RepID=UPI001D94CD57|nr:F0F1 ATP synthase subunit A [Austwickia sp. TVS 96-490-7B]MBW3084592.1 ATP synthase subunit a [Austwickia sp. TVS 96-490-7B]
MSASAMTTPMAGLLITDGGSFTPPEPSEFYQPLWGSGVLTVTRPMLVMTATFVILVAWMLWSLKGAAVVPTRRQHLFETVYNFVRNDIAKDMIGSHDFRRFMPLIFALFTFIALNNFMGVIPFFQNPPMARIGFPIGLVAIVYVTYHFAGVRKHGVAGYFGTLLPAGLPWWIKPVIFVLEFVSNFLVRPLTLTLRLFGNMMAGHMVLVLFVLGGEFLLLHGEGLLKLAGVASYMMAVLMTLFEMLVQFLQAYVFALLAASYIGSSLADEH